MQQNTKLRDLHKAAFKAYQTKDIAQALILFRELILARNDWEHGQAHYMAAHCCEQLGNFDEAEEHYLEALKIEPLNEILLGGYASFLYLHGSPERAFKAHIQILDMEQSQGNEDGAKTTQIALKGLCEKMGLNQEQCELKIKNDLTALSNRESEPASGLA